MNDHETFLLLAARRLDEPVTPEEEADLEAHLAACPSCRAIAAGMRRDDIRLRASLAPVPVSPRVRAAVLAEASGSRRAVGRTAILLAAALGLAVVGVPLIAGGPREPIPSTTPTSNASPAPSSTVDASVTLVPEPSASDGISPPPGPSAQPLPTGTGAFVAGNYTYGIRRDSVAARFQDGVPAGEWWRTTTVRGRVESFGGPITCLIIDGETAWLAGPATTATDGREGLAIYFQLRDGGPDGEGDLAIGYLTNPPQTLTTMQTWCETRFTPDGPFPLTSGDVEVSSDGS